MNLRGFVDRAGPLAARVIPQTPSITRCARCLAALAADVSEHGGRIIYRGVDFRSNWAERQHANLAYTNQISPFNAIFENIFLGLGGFLLPLYFCVRLRLSIRR